MGRPLASSMAADGAAEGLQCTVAVRPSTWCCVRRLRSGRGHLGRRRARSVFATCDPGRVCSVCPGRRRRPRRSLTTLDASPVGKAIMHLFPRFLPGRPPRAVHGPSRPAAMTRRIAVGSISRCAGSSRLLVPGADQHAGVRRRARRQVPASSALTRCSRRHSCTRMPLRRWSVAKPVRDRACRCSSTVARDGSGLLRCLAMPARSSYVPAGTRMAGGWRPASRSVIAGRPARSREELVGAPPRAATWVSRISPDGTGWRCGDARDARRTTSGPGTWRASR